MQVKSKRSARLATSAGPTGPSPGDLTEDGRVERAGRGGRGEDRPMTHDAEPDTEPDLSFWGTRVGNIIGITLGLSGSVMTTAVALDWTAVLVGAGLILTVALAAYVIYEKRWRASRSTSRRESE